LTPETYINKYIKLIQDHAVCILKTFRMQRNALPCNGMFGHVLKQPGELFELSHCPNLQGFVYFAAPTSPQEAMRNQKKTRKNSINKTDR